MAHTADNSASSHLERIHHLYLVSGVYDLRDLRHTSINANNMLGLSDDSCVQLSPLIAPDFGAWSGRRRSMEVHVVVAENDSPTFQQQSRDFDEKLRQEGVTSSLTVIMGCDHFDVVESLSDISFELTNMILSTD